MLVDYTLLWITAVVALLFAVTIRIIQKIAVNPIKLKKIKYEIAELQKHLQENPKLQDNIMKLRAKYQFLAMKPIIISVVLIILLIIIMGKLFSGMYVLYMGEWKLGWFGSYLIFMLLFGLIIRKIWR